jgi:hypothetical protein
MIKKGLSIFCIVIFVAVISAVCFYFYKINTPLDIFKISDKEIISLLKKNWDCQGYMQRYSDFKIQGRTILTKDNIIAGQNGQNFKEVYQGLELIDNRYMKVDLMNSAENSGMVTVIDFKDSKVLKAYGIMLIEAGAN